jgi:hypothetical protein
MKSASKLLAWLSLAACLVIPYVFFRGAMDDTAYKIWLAMASLGWFVFATYSMTRRT